MAVDAHDDVVALLASALRAADERPRPAPQLDLLRARRALRLSRAAANDPERDAACRRLVADALDDVTGDTGRVHRFDAERVYTLSLELLHSDALRRPIVDRAPALLAALAPTRSGADDERLHALCELCAAAVECLAHTGDEPEPARKQRSRSPVDDAEQLILDELMRLAHVLPECAACIGASPSVEVAAAYAALLGAWSRLPGEAMGVSAVVIEATTRYVRAARANLRLPGTKPAHALEASAARVTQRRLALSCIVALERARPALAAAEVQEPALEARANLLGAQMRGLWLLGWAECSPSECPFRSAMRQLVDLCLGDDASLLQLLRSALGLWRDASGLTSRVGFCARDAEAWRQALCPFRLFAELATAIGHDHALVIDWLGAPETGTSCIAYLLALCRAAEAAAGSAAELGGQTVQVALASGDDGEDDEAMGITRLIGRIATALERLGAAGALAYNGAPLVRRLRRAAAVGVSVWARLLAPTRTLTTVLAP